ncbi:M10 family metallopeptidase C-terminal domain-containing protein [Neisseria wadsworthii]|uniref:M10 family metallopeptidase C-terminal domain-containing protein n=1 Tax=Neisseria wadsworthii TaxID=607711 RepID=UPI000D2FD68F|nr:hypothetical protein [Neisseria wadsworthii]
MNNNHKETERQVVHASAVVAGNSGQVNHRAAGSSTAQPPLQDSDESIKIALDAGETRLIKGNVLLNVANAANHQAKVLDFTFGGKTYSAGESTGNFTLKADGTYVLYHQYQNKMPGEPVNVGYTVGSGGQTDQSTLTISFADTYPAYPDADETVNAKGSVSGSVLEGKLYHVGNPVQEVVSYVINGMKYQAGQKAAIFGLGTFVLNKDGSYHFSVEGQRVASVKMPKVEYTVNILTEEGLKADKSTLTINLPANIAANHYAEADAKANVFANLNQTHALESRIETGNLLDKYVGNNKPYISGFSVRGVYYAAGETVEVKNLGLVTINRDGSYFINAKDLPNNRWKMPEIAFTVSNGYKASSAVLRLQMDELPKDQDENHRLEGDGGRNNVLENANYFVTGYKIDGVAYRAGQTAHIKDIGSFVLNADGSYHLSAKDAPIGVWQLLEITYTVSGGKRTKASKLSLVLDNTSKAGELTDENEYNPVPQNVLENASNKLDGKEVGNIFVTGFEVNGLTYQAGDTAQLNEGAFTLNADGSYVFNNHRTLYDVPPVKYTVSNGVKSVTSELKLSLSDLGHLDPYAYMYYDNVSVWFGDNRNGKATNVKGYFTDSGLLVGDAYKTAPATDSQVESGVETLNFYNNSNVLIGDRLNIDKLTWESGGVTIKGSDFDNSIDGIRAYLKSNHDYSSETFKQRLDGMFYFNGDKTTEQKIQIVKDWDVFNYVKTHYADLIDTNPQGGNDTLIGSHEDDIIIGNAGNDTLTGNRGKDTFVFTFNSNSGHDVITDFVKGYDKISFSDVVDTSKLIWEPEIRTLKFAGVQDGHVYENSIYIKDGSVDLKLEDLLGTTTTI